MSGPHGTSWDGGHRTSIRTPWWRTPAGELSWPAALLILAVTAVSVFAALVVGQHRQQAACAEAAGTAQACSSDVYPVQP